jgi:hypothetical protein
MHRHRFQDLLDSPRLPRPPAPPVPVNAFLVCFAVLHPAQQQLYQLAFEQAQAVARPSLPERDLLAVWN